MTTYSAEELAAAAGTDVAWVRRMTELHVLEDEGGRYRDQDIAVIAGMEPWQRELLIPYLSAEVQIKLGM